MTRVQQKIYTITQPGCVHFFPLCYTWTRLRGRGPGAAGFFFFFFFSAADILQLLDKYSSRGSAGSVRGQQQTPRRDAEHLSPPPSALRCTASLAVDALLLFVSCNPRWDVGVFSPDLRCDVHQGLVKTSDWTILNSSDRLIIRNKI